MERPDYYEILQVSPLAEPEVIQAAYRRQAMKYHPDRNSGSKATERMKLLNDAYETLFDSESRKRYDAEHKRANAAKAHEPTVTPPSPLIRFTCGACRAGIEAPISHAGQTFQCPKCGQQLRLRPAKERPAETANPQSKIRTQFTKSALEQLRTLHRSSHTPGDTYCYITLPILCLMFLFGLALLFSLLTPDAAAQSAPRLPAIILVILLQAALAAGAGAVLLFRDPINKKHQQKIERVNLQYTMAPNFSVQYAKLLTAFRTLARENLWEGVESQYGLARGREVGVYKGLPKWMASNVDVYCVDLDGELYYFLPECILIAMERKFYAFKYDRLRLTIDQMKVYHGQQIAGYRWLHARVDGGPDRRFRTNYQIPLYRATFETLAGMELRYDENEVVLLARQANVFANFRAALREWLQICIAIS